MKAALTELGKRVPRKSTLGAIGFCFGGGMIWRLLAAGEPRLSRPRRSTARSRPARA